jgi:iron(III) transport system substrate-binding protein
MPLRLRDDLMLYCEKLAILAMVCLPLGGCWSPSGADVVVYTALDSEFSQPIFHDFNQATGIRVLPKFDTESTKTAGLAAAIDAERQRPRCDVFWNNEILHTVLLEKKGLLASYRPPIAESYPAACRSAAGAWHGFAARARVILVNTKLVPEAKRPRSILDLADPKWRGRIGIAKPLYGTTATQAACLFAAWGDDRAKDYFRRLKANQVQILSGNKQVAMSVGGGRLAFGLTDTDDSLEEIQQASPVTIIYPDQADGGLGTLFIPNTLAIVAGCPHPEAARRLVDYLLSPEVEAKLAAGPSAQIPLNPAVKVKLRVQSPGSVRPMRADFSAAADHWPTAAKFLRDEFTAE